MILSNLSIPLLGIVDTAVMGHLPDPEYVGAIAIGGLIFNLIFWGLGFLRMGTSGITAQAYGNGDFREIRACLGRSVIMAMALAVVILVLQNAIVWVAFILIDGSPRVEQLGADYFVIRIWSTPASLVNLVILGWFVGLQNTKIPLIVLLVTNGSNILLDLLFVVVFKMDVQGVALATVIAEYLGLGIGILLVRRELSGHKKLGSGLALLDPAKFRRMLRINRHIFLRTLCLIFVFAFFTAQGAKQGTVILAANAVLLNFQTFMAYGLDGFAYAAEALVGRAIGSGSPTLLKQSVTAIGQWSVLVAIAFATFYGVYGVELISLMTDIDEVKTTAATYLPWLIMSPLISVASFVLDGIFIGATRSREMQNTMFFSTVLIFIPAWYLLLPYGNHGLWLAFMLFMVTRGLTMAWAYKTGSNGLACSSK